MRCPECGASWTERDLFLAGKKLKQRPLFALAISIVGGVACWVIPGRIDGRIEPWDGAFWWVWFVGSAGVLVLPGYLAPRFFWVWPFALALAQFAYVEMIRGPSPMWPIGLCLLIGCGVVWQLGAGLGAACRNS
jgi:hypothetical protein